MIYYQLEWQLAHNFHSLEFDEVLTTKTFSEGDAFFLLYIYYVIFIKNLSQYAVQTWFCNMVVVVETCMYIRSALRVV